MVVGDCFGHFNECAGHAQNKETAFCLKHLFSEAGNFTDVISPDDDGFNAVGYYSNLSTSLTAVTRYLRTVISVDLYYRNIFRTISPYIAKRRQVKVGKQELTRTLSTVNCLMCCSVLHLVFKNKYIGAYCFGAVIVINCRMTYRMSEYRFVLKFRLHVVAEW